jgi:hypothetical protein
LAVEAAARVDAGEVHSATLLATTALGAVEALQGCEYGLEIRVLCADALKRAASPQVRAARQRAVDYATALAATIRDPRLRRRFGERPLVVTLFDSTPSEMATREGEAQAAVGAEMAGAPRRRDTLTPTLAREEDVSSEDR